MAQRARQRKYYRSAKGRATQDRYSASDKGLEFTRQRGRRRREYHQQWLARRRDDERVYREALFHPSPDKRVIVPGVERLVILSDLQIPFEDPAAVDQALGIIEQVKPDTVVLNGDIVDCYRESVFLQDFRIAKTVTLEQHKKARAFMACLKHIKRKIWLGGNHEERWWRTVKVMHETNQKNAVVDNLLAFAELSIQEVKIHDPIQSFSRIFALDDYGFTYYPYSHRLYFADQNLVVTHGKYVSRHSGYTAKRTFEWLGRSCIVGHTHRLGAYLVTQDGRERGAWENGCLCQLEPEYDDAPNWQQGFSVVRIHGPAFHVVQVPIVRKTPSSKPVAVYGE